MKLFNELSEHLSDMNVEWYLCGGFAIDAYLGKITRKHKDLDITVSFDNMKECIHYLKSKGWEIDAPVGNQRLLPVEFALQHSEFYFDNIWCYKKGADFIKTDKTDGVFKYMKFINREQTELDFIEVMFNKIEKCVFYYQKNNNITLDIHSAFIKKGDISILAPEIVLLYKSRNCENSDYKHDFDMVINNLNKERYNWFINAMNIEYPKGHIWIK
jgi:Aminoglycoside-2''''-adenylyltransferase.